MGLFDRFRGGEKGGDAEVKTSKTQAELKEMMEVQSRLKGLADKLPEGFDEVIEIPAGVDRPANSDGKVRVSKKTHPVTLSLIHIFCSIWIVCVIHEEQL